MPFLDSRAEDHRLYFNRISGIPGWLDESTALRTADILNWQLDNGISGNVLEIGVFRGRYFSLLVNSVRKNKGKALGIDTFQYTSSEQVETALRDTFGSDGLMGVELWTGMSSRFRSHQITHQIGNPRFVSLDGAHDYENVYLDLLLIEQILSHDGLLAADDFLNPLAIGVNQAINHFLSVPRSLVPIAYISNKLFLAHRSREDDYREAFEHLVIEADHSSSDRFRIEIAKARDHIEQYFYGHKMLII